MGSEDPFLSMYKNAEPPTPEEAPSDQQTEQQKAEATSSPE